MRHSSKKSKHRTSRKKDKKKLFFKSDEPIYWNDLQTGLIKTCWNNNECILVLVPYLTSDVINKSQLDFIGESNHGLTRSIFICPDESRCPILETILSYSKWEIYTGVSDTEETEVSAGSDYSSDESEKKKNRYYGIKSLILRREELEMNFYDLKFIDWKTPYHDEKNAILVDNIDHTDSLSVLPVLNIQNKILKTHEIDMSKLVPSEKFSNLMNDPLIEQLLGLDCEMCETSQGKEVVRISCVKLIRKNSTQLIVEEVLDLLVRPENPVMDYLTQYTGVNEDIMREITVTLKDVQKLLYNILTPDTILVGHSLENDLSCLKIYHDRIIDTAVIYPHPSCFDTRGGVYKHSLAYLAKKQLGKNMRNSGKPHNSIDDAIVPIELALIRSLMGRPLLEKSQMTAITNYLEGEVHIYDTMKHEEILNESLADALKDIKIYNFQSDQEVVTGFMNRKKNTKTRVLHICILREFQLYCHRALGKFDISCPSTFYSIGHRISRLVARCYARSKKDIEREQKQLMDDITLIEEGFSNLESTSFNWLDVYSETPEKSNSPISQDTSIDMDNNFGVEEKDVYGDEWAKNIIEKGLICEPKMLYPIRMDERTMILNQLNSQLKTLKENRGSTEMLIASSCGNPVPYLALGRLNRDIQALSSRQENEQIMKVFKSNYIDNTTEAFDALRTIEREKFKTGIYIIA